MRKDGKEKMGGRGANSSSVNTSVARKMSKAEADSLLKVELASPLVKPSKPTKYSEQLFGQTYREARRLVNDNGWSGGGYGSLADDNQPIPTMRALQGVQALINTEKGKIEMDTRLGLASVDDSIKRLQALGVVQVTLNNDVRFLRD